MSMNNLEGIDVKKVKDRTDLKEQKKTGIFWTLMGIFSILLIGLLTFSLYVYDGRVLRRAVKENRAELMEELRKKREIQSKGEEEYPLILDE